MNKLFLLTGLLISAQAFAAPSLPKTLKCNNGHLDDDRAFQVVIEKSRLRLTYWESEIVANRTDLVHAGNTIAILDKTLKGSAEGEITSNRTSALFVYNAKKNQLAATVHFGGDVSHGTETLSCK